MIFRRADDILRARPWAVSQGTAAGRLTHLAALIVVFGMTCGAVMGAFSLIPAGRVLQMVYSAAKVPILLGGTFLLSLPSFFVINTLVGLRDDFAHAVRALVATQAGLTVILAAFAPFTALWYASCANYSAAILFNALMFGAASLAAQRLLRRYYKPLIRRNPRHRAMLWAWLGVYAFVGIQMGWVLRPFIGDPAMETSFFRQKAWSNAYVAIANMVWGLIAR